MLTVIAQQIQECRGLYPATCTWHHLAWYSALHHREFPHNFASACNRLLCSGMLWHCLDCLLCLDCTACNHNFDIKLPGPVVKHSCYQGSPAYYIAFAFARKSRLLDLLLR